MLRCGGWRATPSLSHLSSHSLREALGCDQRVAAHEEFLTSSQAILPASSRSATQPFRSGIGWQIESAWLSLGQRLVVGWQNLVRHGDDAIAVMVIEKISEGFLPDQELRVPPAHLSLRLGKRERNRGQLRESRIFHRLPLLTQIVSSLPAELLAPEENPAMLL